MKSLRELMIGTPVLAQATPLGNTGSFTYNRLVDTVYAFVRLLLQLGEFVAVGFIVWYGVRMVTSKGDPTKYANARKGLLLAFLGAVIIFGAYFIIDTVQGTVKSVVR